MGGCEQVRDWRGASIQIQAGCPRWFGKRYLYEDRFSDGIYHYAELRVRPFSLQANIPPSWRHLCSLSSRQYPRPHLGTLKAQGRNSSRWWDHQLWGGVLHRFFHRLRNERCSPRMVQGFGWDCEGRRFQTSAIWASRLHPFGWWWATGRHDGCSCGWYDLDWQPVHHGQDGPHLPEVQVWQAGDWRVQILWKRCEKDSWRHLHYMPHADRKGQAHLPFSWW